MADNDVTVRYLLRDDATPGLRRLEAQAEATDRRLSQMGGNTRLLTFFDALDGKVGNLDRQLAGLDRTLTSTSRRMQSDLVHGLGLVTAGLTAAAGAADFFALRAVNSFQHTMAAFSVLTGSMQGAQGLYGQLMALNLKSPFDMQPLAASEQTLLGFRVPLAQSLPILTSISNVAAVQQDPNEALMRMALAIGQISQSGFVRAQDLNQLVQAGFPAYQLIPGGKAGLLSGDGRISSGQFLRQLLHPGQGPLAPYGNAAQAMNQTLSGQWSNLTTLVRQEAIKAFSPLGDELVKEMPHLTTVLRGEVRQLAPEFAALGGDLVHGLEGLIPVLSPLLQAGLHGLHELFQAGGPFLDELNQQNPQIAAALGEFFDTLAGEAPELAALFGDLVQLLPPFVHALDDMIKLVDPVLKLVDGLLGLGPVQHFVGDLLVGLLAYRTLMPAAKAVESMSKAMWGLSEAETAAAVAGGAGGLPLTGTRTYRGGKPVPTSPGSRFGRFRGMGWGPASFLFTLGLAPTIDYSTQAGHWLSNHVNPLFGKAPVYVDPLSADYRARSPLWADAIQNDPKLARLMGRGHVVINMQSGAISVTGAKDDAALAQKIRDEIGEWIAERQDRS